MIDTPAMQGKRQRADTAGELRAIAWHWRAIAWALCSLLFVHAGFLMWLAQQPRFTPVYIEVDRAGSFIQMLDAGEHTYTPQEHVLKSYVREFIETLYRRSPDKERMRHDWQALFYRVTPAGNARLRGMVKDHNPLLDDQSVRVEVQRILLPTGRTFDVEWNETTITSNNTVVTKRRSGKLTWEPRPATMRLTHEMLRYNPAGILFDTWDFTGDM